MAKEKNYSKRLQEIEQSNLATLPKRFVDMERQRDKYKKEAEQYREERDTATNKFYEAKAEIEKLKLRLHYHGQKPLQLEVAHFEKSCDGCMCWDGYECNAEIDDECHLVKKQETVYCFSYELENDTLTVLTVDFEWKSFLGCEKIVSQGKTIYEDETKDDC